MAADMALSYLNLITLSLLKIKAHKKFHYEKMILIYVCQSFFLLIFPGLS